MTSLEPVVGVVVPVHGDAKGLRSLLASLDRLAYPHTRLHVIVAVDGRDAETESLLARRSDEVAWIRYFVLPENRGSYAARNVAIEALPAAAEVVLFTDADVVVTPSWVSAHLEILRRYPRSGGPIRVTHQDPPRPAEWVDIHRHFNQEHNVKRLGVSVTANLAVRREVLDRLRFDSSLRSGGDFDFGRRAQSAGFEIGWAEDAVVEHPARPTALEVLRKVDRIGRGARQLRLAGDRTDRRKTNRFRAHQAARRAGVGGTVWWKIQVAAIDLLCSAAYKRHSLRSFLRSHVL